MFFFNMLVVLLGKAIPLHPPFGLWLQSCIGFERPASNSVSPISLVIFNELFFRSCKIFLSGTYYVITDNSVDKIQFLAILLYIAKQN